MAVVPRKRKNRIVFSVANRLMDGTQVWETVGTDKRTAQRRDAAMKREIAEGTYQATVTSATTVGRYARDWLAARTNRTADNDRAWWTNHVSARCEWFEGLRLDDVNGGHVLRLVKELGAPYTRDDGTVRPLASKSVFNIHALVRSMFRDARMADLMTRLCELPHGTLNAKPSTRRKPYSTDVVRMMTTDERLPPDQRMMAALLFYTGMREGEACGRRFRDWDPNAEPLGGLQCNSQYDDQPLKTEKKIDEAPRWIPVHPVLATMLDEWKRVGFEQVFRRKPTEQDFIVPCRAAPKAAGHNRGGGKNHSRSSCYKMFCRMLKTIGVETQTLHATRHTFITLARRDGADKDVLEKITHNARGEMIDIYTHVDWSPLCEAVACFMSRPTRPAKLPALRLVGAL